MSDDEDDKEKKLPTDEELPTSTDGDENKKEEQLGDYVVEVPGGIIYYLRDPDGKLYSREFSTEELIPVHTQHPEVFKNFHDNVVFPEKGIEIHI